MSEPGQHHNDPSKTINKREKEEREREREEKMCEEKGMSRSNLRREEEGVLKSALNNLLYQNPKIGPEH